MDLYATKGAINARLTPLVDRLAAAGVTPDALTLAAVPVAVAGGLCLLVSRGQHVLLALVPVVLVVLRLVLNLLDGNLTPPGPGASTPAASCSTRWGTASPTSR